MSGVHPLGFANHSLFCFYRRDGRRDRKYRRNFRRFLCSTYILIFETRYEWYGFILFFFFSYIDGSGQAVNLWCTATVAKPRGIGRVLRIPAVCLLCRISDEFRTRLVRLSSSGECVWGFFFPGSPLRGGVRV